MAKTFGGATSDRSDCGSDTSLDDLSAFTWCAWVRPTAFTLNRAILSKTGGTLHKLWIISQQGAGPPNGEMQFLVVRATAAANYISSSGLLALNVWNLVAVQYDGGTPAIRMFIGTRTSPMVQIVTFDLAVDGSGAAVSDAGDNFMIGNGNGNASAFQGDMAQVSVWDQLLTLAQLERLRLQTAAFNAFSVGGTVVGRKGYWPLEESAVGTSRDYSGNGNTGTDTGMTVAAQDPPYVFRRRGAHRVLVTPGVGGAAGPSGGVGEGTAVAMALTGRGLGIFASDGLKKGS